MEELCSISFCALLVCLFLPANPFDFGRFFQILHKHFPLVGQRGVPRCPHIFRYNRIEFLTDFTLYYSGSRGRRTRSHRQGQQLICCQIRRCDFSGCCSRCCCNRRRRHEARHLLQLGFGAEFERHLRRFVAESCRRRRCQMREGMSGQDETRLHQLLRRRWWWRWRRRRQRLPLHL